MKKLFCGISLFFLSFFSFAGDASAFVDIGISSDGKTYIFGEYGMIDEKFQGYAEIYTVDIEKNDFVKNGIYKTLPSSSTSSKSGKDVYDALFSKSSWWLKKYNCTPVRSDRILYVADGFKKGNSEIVFKDVEGSTVEREIFYHIKLIKTVENVSNSSKSESILSSFYITLEKTDSNGHLISQNIVGTPSIKRKNVVDYKVDKIFTDSSNRNLIFVVEKTVEDSTGTSIRYMVETIHL